MSKTPMSYIEGLIDWAKDQEGWLSDAIRRLYDKRELTAEDENEIFLMLKKRHGLPVEGAPTPIPIAPLAAGNGEDAEGNPLRLQSISNLQYVNRIKSGAGLSFSSTGLTIIYGDNGSGKSGYGRVFKSACRARHAPSSILPNLYEPKPDQPASADFTVRVGENEPATYHWQDGITLPELSQIAIFDKQCARVQVTKSNEVDFLAYGQDILERLVSLCDRIVVRVKSESDGLSKIPDGLYEQLKAGGESHKWLQALRAESTAEQIEAHAKLSEIDKVRLATLAKKVAERKLNDPAKRSQLLQRKSERLSGLHEKLQRLDVALNDVRAATLKKLVDDYKGAKAAAKIASEQSFKGEPVPGAGTDSWKRLFDAARSYAESEAYKGNTYTDTFDKTCVLCMQPLGAEAQKRMQRFEQYLKDNTAQQLELISKQRQIALDSLAKMEFNLLPADSDLVADLSEDTPELLADTQAYLLALSERCAALKRAIETGTWPDIVPSATSTSPAVELRAGQLAETAKAALLEKPTAAELAEEVEYHLLRERALLEPHIARLKEYVDGLKVRAKLERCRASLDTAPISRKQTSLLNQAVTQRLGNELAGELRLLGVRHIVPQFEPSGTKGKLSHGINLSGMKIPQGGTLADILSEGEELVVAVAAFLAELKLAPKFSVVVFDDPVSSLDHKWRRRVAERIAELATTRQVIVFTHDLAFAFALMDWMNHIGSGSEVHIQAILGGIEAGVVAGGGGEPIEVLKVGKRIKRLRDRLQTATAGFKKDGETEAYRDYMKSTYSLLRRTWERAIEEVLFGDVVMRFRDDVQTNLLKDVATTITRQDCDRIVAAIDRTSAVIDAHDTAATDRGAAPTPEQLDAELSDIEGFVKDVASRRAGGESASAAATTAKVG